MHYHRGNAVPPPERTAAQSPSHEAIRANLKSLLSSDIFTSAIRSSRFLQYVVEESLAGKQDAIKESVLGYEVFDRVRDFDPRIDAIVRVEATKLRLRLERYYQGEGAQASVEIEIPKGTYVPRFSLRPAAPATTESAPRPDQIVPQPIRAEPEPAVPRRFGLKSGIAFAALLAVVVAPALYIRQRQTATPRPIGNLKSIAVLPFINLSSDAENEYFSDGLTEELTDVLARSGIVRVAARTSAFAFKGKGQDVGEIGARLHVDSVLEGSVRKSGQRLRITAQLVQISDGLHLWSQTYDRPAGDIFAVQDDISHSILAALSSQIRRSDHPTPALPRHTANLEAFDLYLRGKSEANRWQLESARKLFEKAATLDPKFAMAHVALAGIYLKEAISEDRPPAESMSRAKESAMTALEIDSGLSQAAAVLGSIEARYDWNWEAAEQRFRKAISLNPNDPEAYFSYAEDVLLPLGRTKEALDQCRSGQQLDPLSISGSLCVPWVLANTGQPEAAIAQYNAMLASGPVPPVIRSARGFAYLKVGKFQEAIEDLEEAQSPGLPTDPFLAYAYARAGQTEKAVRLENQLAARSRQQYVSPMVLALVHIGLGQKSVALDDLERGVEEHSYNAMYLGTESAFDPLRQEPRFQALLRKVHLR
jgi:serine/threonine-protein kinase